MDLDGAAGRVGLARSVVDGEVEMAAATAEVSVAASAVSVEVGAVEAAAAQAGNATPAVNLYNGTIAKGLR